MKFPRHEEYKRIWDFRCKSLKKWKSVEYPEILFDDAYSLWVFQASTIEIKRQQICILKHRDDDLLKLVIEKLEEEILQLNK